MNIINLEESLKGVNLGNIFLNEIKEIKKSLKDSNKKYFLKINDSKKIEREYNAINFFKRYKKIEVPKIAFCSKNILITDLEENLRDNALDDIPEILYKLHMEFFNLKDIKLNNFILDKYYNRDKIFKNFNEDSNLISEYVDVGLIKKIIKNGEEEYIGIPKVMCHGDTHLNNLKKSKNGKPFLLDLEYSHYNNMTFDVSTHIFSHPDNIDNVTNKYFDMFKEHLLRNISKENMINLILKDTLRICSYDLIKNSRHVGDKIANERIQHDVKLIETILEIR